MVRRAATRRLSGSDDLHADVSDLVTAASLASRAAELEAELGKAALPARDRTSPEAWTQARRSFWLARWDLVRCRVALIKRSELNVQAVRGREQQ